MKNIRQSGNALLIIILIVVLGIIGLFVLKGVKQTPNQSSIPSQQNSNSTAAQPNTSKIVIENLTFSGVVNGKMTQGQKGDTYVCVPATTGPIVGKIDNVDYTFEYRALDAKGPGTYKAYVQIGPLNNKNLYYGGDNVSLTINSDQRSGSVDGNLTNLTNSSEKVHITGQWTCPPDF